MFKEDEESIQKRDGSVASRGSGIAGDNGLGEGTNKGGDEK